MSIVTWSHDNLNISKSPSHFSHDNLNTWTYVAYRTIIFSGQKSIGRSYVSISRRRFDYFFSKPLCFTNQNAAPIIVQNSHIPPKCLRWPINMWIFANTWNLWNLWMCVLMWICVDMCIHLWFGEYVKCMYICVYTCIRACTCPCMCAFVRSYVLGALPLGEGGGVKCSPPGNAIFFFEVNSFWILELLCMNIISKW